MTRTVSQLYMIFVGKRVAFDVGRGVEVGCVVLDAAVRYGTERLLIRPVCGIGSRWTMAAMCRLVSDNWPEDSAEDRDANTPAEHAQAGADRTGPGQTAAALPAASGRTGVIGSLPGRVPNQ